MKTKLTREEKGLLSSVERGEWKSVKNLSGELKRYREYARNTLRKKIAELKIEMKRG